MPFSSSGNHPVTPTLSQTLTELKKEGYQQEFQVVAEGLKLEGSEQIIAPEAVKVVKTYRFEGMSNPADMSVLYVLESRDGKKGILIDAFGTYASGKASEVLRRLA